MPKMKKLLQHALSILAILIFFAFAIASKVNKIHMGAFNTYKNVEQGNDTYVIKTDGEKITGEKMSFKTPFLGKLKIILDGQEFEKKEIKAYKDKVRYYYKYKGDFLERIVHGSRVNVYVKYTEVTTTSTDRNGFSRTKTYTRTDHYAQKGEDGDLVGIAGQKDIKNFLSDCQISVQMADLSNKGMRKAIKANSNYLNEIFEIYNKGCVE